MSNRPSAELFREQLETAPLIAILRGVTPDTVLTVSRVLAAEGVRFLEVPLNSPDPFASIANLAADPPDNVQVGAGTVLRPEDVDAVAQAGGTYILSPNMNPAVVRRTKERGLISIPGFFTPSEAFGAVDAGADLVKLFPAARLGPKYIKDLKAVLPTPVVAVGGVGPDNLRDYLEMGACAAGIGSALYRPGVSAEELRANAQLFRQCIQSE